MIMAEFEIEGKTSNQKCVVFVIKDNSGNLKWRKDPKTYSGALRLGAKSGVWYYFADTRVLALCKGDAFEYKNIKVLIGDVPINFLECGATYSGDKGGITLPSAVLITKENIHWEIFGVYC